MRRNYRGIIANEINISRCVTFVTKYVLPFENNCKKNVAGKSVETFCWREFREIMYWNAKG